MNLDLTWTLPSPVPSCGFRALYRKNTLPGYSISDISGSVSGATITIPAPASYDGFVQSNCCGDNISDITTSLFGVNAYSPFHVDVAINGSNEFEVTITSDYANPYDLLVDGTFVGTLITPTTYPFSLTYPAGSLTYSIVIPGQVNIATLISDITVTMYAPVFNGGGELQQLDTLNTPDYFRFYWDGDTSGTSWSGSPTNLPSFTLTQLAPTDVDTSGTVLTSNLTTTWIQESIYMAGVSPYNFITFEVVDPVDNSIVATQVTTPAPIGFRTLLLSLTKTVTTIESGSEFYMKTYWGDGTLIESRTFYLP
jgi:hypothetical protein